jgi:hypothetical protein
MPEKHTKVLVTDGEGHYETAELVGEIYLGTEPTGCLIWSHHTPRYYRSFNFTNITHWAELSTPEKGER